MNALESMWSNYTRFTRSVAVYPGGDLALPYVALGLVDEVAEVAEKALELRNLMFVSQTGAKAKYEAVQAEIGDVLWYVARLADHIGIELYLVIGSMHYEGEANVQDVVNHMHICAGQVAGRIKKLLRDGDTWSEDKRAEQMAIAIKGLRGVLSACQVLARFSGSTLEKIAAQNQAKLEGRRDRGVLQGDGDTR